MRFTSLLIGAFATSALALPSVSPKLGYPAALAPRQSCAETCGTVCYYQTTIDTAVSNGYNLYQEGQTQGSDDYPHTYNNYEGFDFPVSGPYQEYPIMDNFQPYDGGSPGADRVIFNTDGDYAGVITHTGASGDDFVACSGANP